MRSHGLMCYVLLSSRRATGLGQRPAAAWIGRFSVASPLQERHNASEVRQRRHLVADAPGGAAVARLRQDGQRGRAERCRSGVGPGARRATPAAAHRSAFSGWSAVIRTMGRFFGLVEGFEREVEYFLLEELETTAAFRPILKFPGPGNPPVRITGHRPLPA